MPRPQNLKGVLLLPEENDTQSAAKSKEPRNPWSHNSAVIFSPQQQQPQNLNSTVTPPSTITSNLRALLHDNKQAVVIHPLSRDSMSQSPVIRLSPATSSSIWNLQPTKILPVMAKNKPQNLITQGFDLSRLGRVQEQTRFGKPGELVYNKKGLASAPQQHPSSRGADVSHKGSSSEEQSKDRHLQSDHNLGDNSTMQCLIQTEVVHGLEEQLAIEKQRLHEMQKQMVEKLNSQSVHLPKQQERSLILHHPSLLAWPGTNVSNPLQKEFPDTVLAVSHHLWEGNGINIFQDMTNCMEYYKVNCVRPPFTYASLIRWAILESPQKQLALNEIYHWFTRMFAFFRSNKITWKEVLDDLKEYLVEGRSRLRFLFSVCRQMGRRRVSRKTLENYLFSVSFCEHKQQIAPSSWSQTEELFPFKKSCRTSPRDLDVSYVTYCKVKHVHLGREGELQPTLHLNWNYSLKNAVRHNLSLHKCFVRVENIRGAVWMVDELEFQRKRGMRSSR